MSASTTFAALPEELEAAGAGTDAAGLAGTAALDTHGLAGTATLDTLASTIPTCCPRAACMAGATGRIFRESTWYAIISAAEVGHSL